MTTIVIVVFVLILSVLALSFLIRKDRKSVSDIIQSNNSSLDIGAITLGARFGEPLPENKSQNLGSEVHPSNQPEFTKRRSAVISNDSLVSLEAVVQGAWFGMDVTSNLMQIDEHVYSAMSSLAGEQLDTIGDLSKSLSNWESAELGQSLPQEAVSKLMGHLAEPRVAQNLENMGVQVEMPNLSNQEGYDLILNGEYFVNVKTIADASSLSRHFENYPQIPVIVPGDMRDIPDGAISFSVDESIDKVISALDLQKENLVLVDNQLIHSEMIEQTESVSDGLLGSVDPTAGIPLITLAISGYREIRLLSQQKTELYISAKNLSLDLVGTGGGGLAGASTGAIIGTAIMPGIGTVAGSVIGGGGGAYVARFITDKIKKHPLKKAIKKYDQGVEKSESEIQSIQEKATQEINNEKQALNEDFTESTKLLKSEIKDECTALIQARQNILRIGCTDAQDLLARSRNQIEQDLHQLQTISMWKRMVIGEKLRHELQIRIEEIKRLSRHLKSYDEKIISTRQDLVGDDAVHFLQFILCADADNADIVKMIQSADAKRQELEVNWQTSFMEKRQRLIEERFSTIKKLTEKIQIQQKEVNQKIEVIVQKLEPLRQSCMKKLDQLGKKSPQTKK